MNIKKLFVWTYTLVMMCCLDPYALSTLTGHA